MSTLVWAKRIVKALSSHVDEVEDLQNGQLEEVHVSRLKFNGDADLDKTSVMPHVISSETGMQVQGSMELLMDNDDLLVRIHWRGLAASEDTLELIQQIHEDVLILLLWMLLRQTSLSVLPERPKNLLQN